MSPTCRTRSWSSPTPTMARSTPPRGTASPPTARLTGPLAAAGVQNVAYTILIPFVPTLQSDFRMSTLAIGVAFAGFTATKAAVQPFGGWIVDRFGARLVGGGALLVSTVAIGLLAFATSGEQVIVLRLLWGIGEGLAMP